MATDVTLPGSYISVLDLQASYTGLDFTTLQPGQVARAIQRASRWIDKICKQTLYVTKNTVQLAQNKYPECYTIDQETGYLDLWPRFFPIQSELTVSYQYGINLNGGTPVTIPNAYVQLFDRWMRVQTDYLGVWGQGVLWPAPLYVNLTYVNGWNVAQLATAVTTSTNQATMKPQVGAATLLGFAAGSVVEVQDSTTASEIMTVQSVSGNTITFTTNFTQNHAADITFADPQFALAQQACINLASYFLKERGMGPIALHDNSFTNNRGNDLPQELLTDVENFLEDYVAHS